jgi:hypothetical protein
MKNTIANRKKFIATAKAVLPYCASQEEFFKWVSAVYKHRPERLGSGLYRVAYSMPFGLVVKVPSFRSVDRRVRENQINEVNSFNAFPRRAFYHAARIYYYDSKHNFLFQRRAKRVRSEVLYRKFSSSWLKEAFEGWFYTDIHSGNIGTIGKKLVCIDWGFQTPDRIRNKIPIGE